MEHSPNTDTPVSTIFSTVKTLLLSGLIFLFPLFFLTTTQEFFVTNKFYLLGFGALLLLTISTLEYLVTKRIVWKKNMFDNIVIFFLVTIGLSTIFTPNWRQALLSTNYGLVMMSALAIIYFYLSRQGERGMRVMGIKINPMKALMTAAGILSVVAIVFFFQPFKSLTVPPALQFLKNPTFTPMGDQLDLVIFLGFFVVYLFLNIVANPHKVDVSPEASTAEKKQSMGQIINSGLLLVVLTALLLNVYSLFKPALLGQDPTTNGGLLLTPFRLSWYAAVEILKNPVTALFGIGVDNFSAIFTQVKDVFYNQSPLWQISSFVVSRSTLLHVLTESGLFGGIAFILLLGYLFRTALGRGRGTEMGGTHYGVNLFLTLYMLFVVIFFPPSLPVFFLFFVLLAEQARHSGVVRSHGTESRQQFISDISLIMPVYIGILLVSFGFIGISAFLLGRTYAAEYYFRQAFNGIITNSAKTLYDNQRQAILLNPYIERFRTSFSQTNLLIANNIAARGIGDGKTAPKISDADRNTIAQAIQAAIQEAKAGVALNPQKANNWENLALIYRNVLNVAQGADVWTVSSYQRAIVLDPQNPGYRLNLGGVYFSVGNYQEAARLFEQAVGLKPDWSNAYYNLAWALFQNQEYPRAVLVMQNVISLLDPKKDAADYQRVQKDLEDFRKKLPQDQAQQAPAAQQTNEQPKLSLPTAAPTLSPKIQLPNPKAASPEAIPVAPAVKR